MKFFKILFLVSVSFFILVLSLTVSNDFSQDLGRHLLLGKIIVATKSVPAINLLSYTYPNFPFVNHHWLSEVVFYGLSHVLGINSLQVLKIVASLFSFFCVLLVGWKLRKSLIVVVLVSLFFAPLFFWRVNIRPELFGYVFFSLLLLILFLFHSKRWVPAAVIAILLLWVNLHSTWLFGYVLALFISLRRKSWKLALFSTLILFVNPNGIYGPLFPITVLTNYGYTIAENMTVFFMVQHVGSRQYWYLLIAVVVGVVGSVKLIVRRRYWEACVLAVFSIAAFFQNRHSAFFCLSGVAFVPLIIPYKLDVYIQRPVFLLLASFLIFFTSSSILSNHFYEFFSVDKQFGTEVKNQYSDFEKWAKLNLQGKRIFNTFDIGGYLAYALYPQNRVFVDNRPEAYPEESFKEEYIPLQSDRQIREKLFAKWGIDTVVMNHTDGTSWGGTFLREMLQDTKWAITYLDGYAIVFEKGKKTKNSILEDAINRTEHKTELMNLYILSRFANNKDMQNAAYQKISNNFKESCEYARVTRFELMQNTDFFSQEKGRTIGSSYWWCF